MILDRESFNSRLFGLVGFNQTTDPSYPEITPSLLESRSGKRVDSEHALINVENIDQCIKNFSQYVYEAYSGTETYQQGDKVSESGLNYEYVNTTPSSGNTPPNLTYWKEIDSLSDYLTKAVTQGQNEMIDAIFDHKKIKKRTKSIYENIMLYDGMLNRRDLVPNEDKFVGLQIELRKDRSLTSIINSIGFALKGSGITELNLELWHSSQNEKLKDITINVANGSTKWTQGIGEILRYQEESLGILGGVYWLGYRQSDLGTDQAIKFNIKRLVDCRCNKQMNYYYRNWSQYSPTIGFSIDESEMMGTEDFDPNNVVTDPTNNYGLNLNYSCKCDLENFLIANEELLAHPLNLSIAMVLMRDMANTTRGTNAQAQLVAQQAKKEVYEVGDNPPRGTIYNRWKDSIDAASIDLSNLNDRCLPTANGGVKVGTRNFSVEPY